ncbi:hypothetical protein IHE44_0005034 [Lamprotornis superbus]|uniref:HotDog ACOT-type domain-containing protein n=1 Tax=Lamprotornis superbus TaxID=245042 RepID=A0A835NYS8_9PASS|nr:hypothetical protein IHE44_0005034 [Lamprotornis superbus]
MRKLPSVLARTLTSGTSASPGFPDMSKVRSKLRDIVGASTNWRDHVQAMQERKALHTLLAKRQEDLPPRRMKDSYLEVILPLGSQPEIREKYLNVHNSVRFGRILEDLDSLGVLICYTHTKQEMQQRSPLSIVTALLHDGDYSPVLDATFVMVARDPENKRPAFVNPLIPESPEEEEIFKQGELNKLKRIEFSTASLLKMAPTAEERNIERNIFNRIFGGFLMRKAFELGWATACSYGGSRPFIVSVDDIMFQKPVEVGSLLLLSGQVCYTEKNYIQIRVHSEVYNANTREHHTTNTFHFTFISENEVPQVDGAFSSCS